jgi:DNA-binding transcriptional MocR family regulator
MERTTYYQLPKWLFEKLVDKKISIGAFKTYLLMYDRLRLSIEKKWKDSEGKVYINYSYEALCERLKCSRQAVANNLKELIELKMIRVKKSYSKPNKYYLNFEKDSQEKLTSNSQVFLDSSKNDFSKNFNNITSVNQNWQQILLEKEGDKNERM